MVESTKLRDTESWRRSRGLILACLIVCCSAAGCSDKIERIPVRGRVLIDGEPLAYGFITVAPTNARPALAELDQEGRFELFTYEPGDGTVLGKHQLSVNSGEVLNSVSVRWHAPKRYAGLSTSGLFLEVTADMEEEVVIELTWDGGKPFVETARISGEE